MINHTILLLPPRSMEARGHPVPTHLKLSIQREALWLKTQRFW